MRDGERKGSIWRDKGEKRENIERVGRKRERCREEIDVQGRV